MSTEGKKLRILLSAYACEPGKGSEPGVGWNLAVHLAQHHEVWVLTRANNRPIIEAEVTRNPIPGLYFIYHDLPAWARFWKRGERGVRLYYYLWQITAIPLVRRLHQEMGFDLAHHATFVKYWTPSALSFLNEVPFIWGPVGGGESAPLSFWPTLGVHGIVYETARTWARALGEMDPLVQHTARRAALALATTPETMTRLKQLGARCVEVISQVALPNEEASALARLPPPQERSVRFTSIGHLLALKGFHLGILAFAQSGLHDAEYWIIGDGPERRRLEVLAQRVGVADRVRFLGKLPRAEVLVRLAETYALVHPSLHDSGGWVCLEAMAAGRPIICLDLGGPAMQVTKETGFKIAARTPEQSVEEIAKAMLQLASDHDLCRRMGEAGKRRVAESFIWARRAREISHAYHCAIKVTQKAV